MQSGMDARNRKNPQRTKQPPPTVEAVEYGSGLPVAGDGTFHNATILQQHKSEKYHLKIIVNQNVFCVKEIAYILK